MSLQGLFNRVLLLSLLLAAAKMCCSPLDSKKGCKSLTGQTQLGYQDSRLGVSWVLVLRNTLEITVEQGPLALKMFLRGQDDPPETWLKNGLFSA